MHHFKSMQYLNTVYPEIHDAVKDVDDRMKYENVGKYMTFSDNSKTGAYILIKEIKTPGSIL